VCQVCLQVNFDVDSTFIYLNEILVSFIVALHLQIYILGEHMTSNQNQVFKNQYQESVNFASRLFRIILTFRGVTTKREECWYDPRRPDLGQETIYLILNSLHALAPLLLPVVAVASSSRRGESKTF
jgi:hypothetical protein